MNKILRVFLRVSKWVALTFAVLFLFLVGMIIYNMPSPATISEAIEKQKIQSTRNEITQSVSSPAVVSAQSSSNVNAEPKTEAKANSIQSANQDVINRYLLNRYFSNETKTAPEICKYLGTARDIRKINQVEIESEIARVARGDKLGDPLVETILAPLGWVFQRPSFTRLMKTVMDSKKSSGSALLDKANLLKNAALATADLVANKQEIEGVTDRSYLLYMLYKAARENPSLIGAPATQEICNRFQEKIFDSASDLKASHAEFRRFIDAAGVKPELIGYDPEYATQYKIVSDGSHIHLQGGWIQQVFDSKE